MAKLYISLGTNIERQYHVAQGLDALEQLFGQLTLSSLFESEAVGFQGQPFYNMVIGVDTELSLAEAAKELRAIEFANGRALNAKKFSPRTLDLDILLFDDLVLVEPVQLPRAEILHNAFVLWPLAEIAGHCLHPVEQISYQKLWQQYDKQSQKLQKVPLEWRSKIRKVK